MWIMKTILVTGGTGYIGSHTAHSLHAKGYNVVVLDDLSNSNVKYLRPEFKFYKGDILDKEFVSKIFIENKIDAVTHFAGKVSVHESTQKPDLYHKVNTDGVAVLLKVMNENDVDKIIFSSTAAIYGNSEIQPVTEELPTEPINPYGESKLNAEYNIQESGINYVIFRYFNVAGANLERGLKYDPLVEATHLIPAVNEAALGIRPKLMIFGTDYPTKDGTAIRDYVHVQDLADAHVLGVEYLIEGKESKTMNLSSHSGFSVREVYNTAGKVLDMVIPMEETERREGDPAILIATNERAQSSLGWLPKLSLEEMIKTDYESKK